MSANKYKPRVFVLPEDDADREIANGFLLHPSLDLRAIQVIRSAGGWKNVRDKFVSEHIKILKNYSKTHVVLLIDFDEDAEKLEYVKSSIPAELEERAFVIGAWSNPEALRGADLGDFETIGWNLAEACRSGSDSPWDHDLLKHNAEELHRMTPILKPILFPD
jgi:hypothetical protein